MHPCSSIISIAMIGPTNNRELLRSKQINKRCQVQFPVALVHNNYAVHQHGWNKLFGFGRGKCIVGNQNFRIDDIFYLLFICHVILSPYHIFCCFCIVLFTDDLSEDYRCKIIEDNGKALKLNREKKLK